MESDRESSSAVGRALVVQDVGGVARSGQGRSGAVGSGVNSGLNGPSSTWIRRTVGGVRQDLAGVQTEQPRGVGGGRAQDNRYQSMAKRRGESRGRPSPKSTQMCVDVLGESWAPRPWTFTCKVAGVSGGPNLLVPGSSLDGRRLDAVQARRIPRSSGQVVVRLAARGFARDGTCHARFQKAQARALTGVQASPGLLEAVWKASKPGVARRGGL